MESKRFYTDGMATHLLVYEDGRVWTTKRNKFLVPQVNTAGYLWYNTTYWFGKAFLAHTMVALVFIGDPPDEKHEINHKDLDKRNNHWSNLEWCTHSYNILHARKVKHWEPGRRGFKHSASTRALMSKAKFKSVRCTRDGEELFFNSIQEFLEAFGTYRKKFNRVVNSIHTVDGWAIRYA